MASDPPGPRVERRRYARVFFTPPLVAKVGRVTVELLDLNLAGATIAHYEHLAPAQRGELRFAYGSGEVSVPCIVKRCHISGLKHVLTGRNAFRSVIVFPDLNDGARRSLERLMVAAIMKMAEPGGATGSIRP